MNFSLQRTQQNSRWRIWYFMTSQALNTNFSFFFVFFFRFSSNIPQYLLFGTAVPFECVSQFACARRLSPDSMLGNIRSLPRFPKKYWCSLCIFKPPSSPNIQGPKPHSKSHSIHDVQQILSELHIVHRQNEVCVLLSYATVSIFFLAEIWLQHYGFLQP